MQWQFFPLINDKCKPFKAQRKMIYFTCQNIQQELACVFQTSFSAVCATEYNTHTIQNAEITNEGRKPEKKAATLENRKQKDIMT